MSVMAHKRSEILIFESTYLSRDYQCFFLPQPTNMKTYLCLCLLAWNLYSFSQGSVDRSSFNPQVAVQFVNDYIHTIDDEQINTNTWIKDNPLLTKKFKSEYKKSLKNDFDPILNAQDYPEKGFRILNSDSSTGYVNLEGVDYPEFSITAKVVSEDGKWLVDGCGIVNIPEDKREK